MASVASYGLCQTACNAGAVTCYSAAGFVFGTVTAGVGIPTAIATCNSILGTCMAACATKFLAEASAETAATGGVIGPIIVAGGLGLTLWAAQSAPVAAEAAAGSTTTAAAAAAAAGTTASGMTAIGIISVIIARLGTLYVGYKGYKFVQVGVGNWRGDAPADTSAAESIVAFPANMEVEINITAELEQENPDLVAEFRHNYSSYVGQTGKVLRIENGRVIVKMDISWGAYAWTKLRLQRNEVPFPHQILIPRVDVNSEIQRLVALNSTI